MDSPATNRLTCSFGENGCPTTQSILIREAACLEKISTLEKAVLEMKGLLWKFLISTSALVAAIEVGFKFVPKG